MRKPMRMTGQKQVETGCKVIHPEVGRCGGDFETTAWGGEERRGESGCKEDAGPAGGC